MEGDALVPSVEEDLGFPRACVAVLVGVEEEHENVGDQDGEGVVDPSDWDSEGGLGEG